MKRKFEPTGIILRQLTLLAATLPAVKECDDTGQPILTRVKKQGHQLIKEGKREVGGTKIMKGKFYNVYDFIYVNHYNKLVEEFKKGGMKAVDEYSRTIRMNHFNSLPWYQRAGIMIRGVLKKLRLTPTVSRN